METAILRLTLDIEVVLDDGETDTSWVTDEITGTKGTLNVGGLAFTATNMKVEA